MTKQEARLSEKVEDAVQECQSAILDLIQQRGGGSKRALASWGSLRSAILAALDEARDKALEEASQVIRDWHLEGMELPQSGCRTSICACGEQIRRIRLHALKSKPNSVDKSSR